MLKRLIISESAKDATGKAVWILGSNYATSKNTATIQRDIQYAINIETEKAVAELKGRFTAPVVCICGSTKFKQAWISENARLTDLGNIVLAVGLWGHHERTYPSPEHKIRLDEIHKRKIDLCDWVWVLDIGGCIGESTRSEIDYAEHLGKTVRFLSAEIPDYIEPVDSIAAERDELKRQNAELVKALEILLRMTGTNGCPEWSCIRRICNEALASTQERKL